MLIRFLVFCFYCSVFANNKINVEVTLVVGELGVLSKQKFRELDVGITVYKVFEGVLEMALN